jgi:hypothetical protein
MTLSTKRLSLLPTPKSQEELLKFLEINFKRIVDLFAQQWLSGDIADNSIGSNHIIDGSIIEDDLHPQLILPGDRLFSLPADKLTGGRLENGYLLAGNIRTADSGVSRVVFDSSGLQIYNLVRDKFGLRLFNNVGEVLKPNIQVFTGDGTWSPPVGFRWAWAGAQAAGGGGGAADGAAGAVAAAGGGGGGGFCEKIYDRTELIGNQAVTVGGGGTAGATPGGTGGVGGNSAFAGLAATGGSGGVGGGNTVNDAPGNNGAGGGAASGGDINIPGGDGGWGIRFGVIGQGIGGFGGASHWGGSIRSSGPTGAAGATGKNYGGGGGGGIADTATDRAGGVGAPGLVVVIAYYL